MSRIKRHRDYVLKWLALAWEKNPDQRLCQLIVNAAWRLSHNPDVFYVEDEQLIEALEELIMEDEANV